MRRGAVAAVALLCGLGLTPAVPVLPATAAVAVGPGSAPTTVAPPRAQVRPGPAVVVVGVGGLRWSDLGPDTPALNALASRAAVGVLSVKALSAAGRPATCRADGWLTLGAGARAGWIGQHDERCTAELPRLAGDGPAGRGLVGANAATRDGAVLGALLPAVEGVRDVGADLAPQGGAGSRIALGRPRDGADGFASTSPPGTLVDLLDAGDVTSRASLRAADAAVAREVAQLAAGADLLVVGVSDRTGTRTPRLHVAMATGPHFPRGALRSASTRRAPYVQLIDVAPTVVQVLGAEVPAVMDGQPMTVQGPAPRVAALVDLQDKADGVRRATVPFFVVLVAVLLVLLTVLRGRAAQTAALAGVAALGASYVANLLPWWRAPSPLAALLGIVAVLAVLVGVLAARTRHPVGWTAGGVAAVMGADLVAGAPLQMSSVAGYSPLVAGRFAGIGNVAFGVLLACVLLATASAAAGRSRRATVLVVAVAGVLAVAVDGAPPWGSDVGGVLSLVPSFVLLGLLLTGTRVSVLRLGAALAAAVVVVAGFALADLSRPVSRRTHLGRFAAQVRDGTAGDVLARKADAVFGLLFHSPVTALLPLVVAGAVYVVSRPPPLLRRTFAAVPEFRPALAASGLGSLLGFGLNDSGAAVVALALLVVVPAGVAVVAGVSRSPAAPPRL